MNAIVARHFLALWPNCVIKKALKLPLRIAEGGAALGGPKKALGGPKIPHGQKQFQITLLAQHYDETKHGRKCSHFIWSFYRGRSQQDSANPSWAFCGSTFRVLQLSQLHILSQCVTPCTLPKNPILPLVLGIVFFQ